MTQETLLWHIAYIVLVVVPAYYVGYINGKNPTGLPKFDNPPPPPPPLTPSKDFKHVNYESGYFVFTLLEEVDSFSNSEGKRFVYTMQIHSQVVYSSIENAQKDIDSVFAVNAPSWQQFMIIPATLKQL